MNKLYFWVLVGRSEHAAAVKIREGDARNGVSNERRSKSMNVKGTE